MQKTAAAIVKHYLEIFIIIEAIKNRKNRNPDAELTRITLSSAYNISHDMDDLIRLNQGDNVEAITASLNTHIALVQKTLKQRQRLIARIFKDPPLPTDFDACVNEAYHKAKLRESA